MDSRSAWCVAGECMCVGHAVLLRQLTAELEGRVSHAESVIQKVRGSLEGIQEVLFDADIRTSGPSVLPAETRTKAR